MNHPLDGTQGGSHGRPGELLRDHVFPGLRLSVSQAARDLGIAHQTLHRILAGDADITVAMLPADIIERMRVRDGY